MYLLDTMILDERPIHILLKLKMKVITYKGSATSPLN